MPNEFQVGYFLGEMRGFWDEWPKTPFFIWGKTIRKPGNHEQA
jgi:hypothetical protein